MLSIGSFVSVRQRGLTDGNQRKLSSAITERTQKTPAAMILMPSDRLGLRESPVAMRRGQGRSALSKFMRFQKIGDNLGYLERDFSIAFWLNKVENRQQSCKTNAVLRSRKKEVILKSKRRSHEKRALNVDSHAWDNRNVSITLRHLSEKFRLQEETRRPLPAAAAAG